MITLTDDNFTETVFTTNKLALVQFSAPWCSSCKEVVPTIQKLEESYPSVVFGKVDVDSFPALADNYNIDKLPTFLLFKNRQISNFIIGNEKLSEFKKIIEKEL